LVILLPFGNISMNILSNAIAFNIVSSMDNEEDYIQKYENFMKTIVSEGIITIIINNITINMKKSNNQQIIMYMIIMKQIQYN
jgi:hypothetical protein